MVWREMPTLQLVCGEAAALLQITRMSDNLFRRRLSAKLTALVAIAVEQVGREGHALAQRATKQVARADAKRFASQIHAGHFDRGMKLDAVVV